MIGANVLSPTDAASQEPMVGSAQRVAVARARAPRDAAVQHCLGYLGSKHSDFELEGSARSVVQFEGILPEAAPCVVYAPIDLDGQVSIVVDVPPEMYEPVRLVVHLARSCLYPLTTLGSPLACCMHHALFNGLILLIIRRYCYYYTIIITV